MVWGCHVTDAGGSCFNKAFLQKNPFLAPGGSSLVQKVPAPREHLPVLGTQLVGGTLNRTRILSCTPLPCSCPQPRGLRYPARVDPQGKCQMGPLCS